MGLEKIETSPGRVLALWHINEDESTLAAHLGEDAPENVTNAQKRLEWLAGRVLVKEALLSLHLPYRGLIKDAFGKPFPVGHDYQLSLSHSFPYAAVLLDAHQSVGIDLEQPKEKLLRIAPRMFHPTELADAGTDLIKLCIYWCAKEALIKVYGKKDLTFAKSLLVAPFSRKTEGEIVGSIIVDNEERVIPLCYTVTPDFVLVFNKATTL
ncbi:4'-phosphopantetheinyl transferase family protein [Parachryseolinea silvisoli]|uniref:4'-phosphopantetheinyl transferase family protein n=1 Tax=Parachryseolinea silvisoli TaxID=2873601 RepID=UPI002265EB1E|nr:4'-phosphopantetheinyl transferase superfamily protein [Parachryseolinea silvisoli]MCD9017232.1 4'-phosphopantetheinyl transferase superfamily protein [Parachryseolinea silvisoli]